MWLYPETNHKTKKEIQNFLLDWNPSFWKPTFLESSDMGSINESEHNNNNWIIMLLKATATRPHFRSVNSASLFPQPLTRKSKLDSET